MAVLSIGAGMLRHEGAVHLDRMPLPGIDVVHDLEVVPYPFSDASFDKIIACDVLEHIRNIIPCIEECHRLLVPKGRLWIHTNYWNTKQSFTDPTHVRFFTENSFDFFVPGTFFCEKYPFYSKVRFEKVQWHMEASELVVELAKI